MKYSIYKNPVFRVDIEPSAGQTKVTAGGILSPVLQKAVTQEMAFFDNQKYIAELREETADPTFASYYRRYKSALIYSTWMPPIPSPAFKRMVNGRMKSALGKYRPEQVTISITEECPNRCLHCALPNKNNHSKLTVDETKDAIDQAIDAGATNIIFDGGEPLGYAGLEELISYVDPKKAIACMFTSGVGLTEDKAKSLKDAGLYSISVSIDSPFEEQHDHMRGVSGVFKNAAAGIKNALAAGLLVNIYVVLAPHNVNDLDAVYDFAKSLGVHELSFYEIVPTGRWIDNTSDILTPEQHEIFKQFVEECGKDKTGPKLFSGPLVVNEFGCMAGRQWMHITPEGDILPCSCVPIPYGNVKTGKNAVKKAWKKIRADPAYSRGADCLMRNPEFREEYGEQFR
ncbi:radical SAM/SPASM domain-containing protein [Methanimicrococcus blatticola]|uniref:MoaA/NifB/PqqE/SkfB family radical SAM enzyme n=1 Tax=Methanimicrococcus blatticola TaxID=91560 RepID=A0A484F2M4_9EURY|nr:radical SAM protein [Methanimicrococcus blatticola]MBZ3935329.1 radical SAM protein [Methanimicrococcus blatticola]MCC2508573.1 radical SAM protein [Methanimicrococcus blatticola]TDQ67881.1 MoaA/NifB/PqqE/SkfB family radical SAM enzyme [Methanimicrococcus blatticola]